MLSADPKSFTENGDHGRESDAEEAINRMAHVGCFPPLLELLQGPLTGIDFLSDFWEQERLHIPGDENPVLQKYVTGLMTIDDVDRLLTTVYAAGPRKWDSVRLGRDGTLIPPEEFLYNRDGTLAEVDVERVLSLYRNGASIILNSVHESFPPVATLCCAVSQFFDLQVHVNAYITPPKAQGFPRHFDSHDVFLLQVAGEKNWHTYPSSVPLATTAIQNDGHGEPTGPRSHLRLRAGDVLYIPRGMLHQGMTSDSMSFHLTVGVHPYTWAQLFKDVVSELEVEEISFRRSVAPRVSSLDWQRNHFRDVLGALSERLNDVDRAGRLARRKADEAERQIRLPTRGLFTHASSAADVSLATPVRLREHSDPKIERTDGDVRLRFSNSMLRLPSFTEVHLRALCSGAPIRAEDLPRSLDDEGKLVLVRRLVREGLLEVQEWR